MDSETVQWSKLPKDFLVMVAKRLDTSTDILRLSAVCTSWRSLLPRSTKNDSALFSVKFPFPIHPKPTYILKHPGYFELSKRTTYYIEPSNFEKSNARSSSSKAWMVCVEESEPGKIKMYDPFSKIRFWSEPKISSKVLDLLNFRVSEVSKVCMLYFVTLQENPMTNFFEYECMNAKKVVMSSIPAWTDNNSVDCAVLTIHTGGKLAYFKLGDKLWSKINDGLEDPHYDDIVYRKGKFYAIDYTGRVIVIDSSLNVREIESPVSHRHEHDLVVDQYRYLVESLGDLYLVDKTSDYFGYGLSISDEGKDKAESDPKWSGKIVVYKFKDDGQEWIRVTSLGDRSFFIGDDCCFSVSASQFSGCKGNCIYFTTFQFHDESIHPGHGIGIFDFENGSVRRLSSFKSYSQTLWPPPTWLKLASPNRPSKRSSRRSSRPSSSRN